MVDAHLMQVGGVEVGDGRFRRVAAELDRRAGFSAPNDEGVVQQAALLQVGEQRAGGLVVR